MAEQFDPAQQWQVRPSAVSLDVMADVRPHPGLPYMRNVFSPDNVVTATPGQRAVDAFNDAGPDMVRPLASHGSYLAELERLETLRTTFAEARDPHLATLVYKLITNVSDRRSEIAREEIYIAHREVVDSPVEYWIAYQAKNARAASHFLLSRLVGFSESHHNVPMAQPVVAGRDRLASILPTDYKSPRVFTTVDPFVRSS